MLKKATIMLVLLAGTFLMQNCIVSDSLGLSPDRVTGTKAKQMITDGMQFQIMLDLMMGNTGEMIWDTIMPGILSGIDDTKYYKKSSVQSCADSLMFFDPSYIKVICNLKADPAVF